MALECEMISYDPESCHLVGKVDVAKLQPITYDPMNHHYLVLGEKVGQAFHDGLTLK